VSFALIFDMDGVIIHSNPLHKEAWEQFNRRYGLETTPAMERWMYGKRNDRIVREFFGAELGDADVFERGAAKEALYRQLMRARLEESLVPGVAEFLERHKDRPIGLGTNAERANVDFVLDAELSGGGNLRRYFRSAVSGHDVERPKPDPEIYLRVASELGVDPGTCVVFEDSPSGVAAGKAAGMRVVGVRTTHRDLDVDFAVDDFESAGLEEWISRQQSVSR